MQCPFLRRMNVKYCGQYRRTMIPSGGTKLTTDRCSGPEHRTCPLFRKRPAEPQGDGACPFLQVRDVHFCSVAQVRKMIPCNQLAISRCTDDGHRYCELYLAMAGPGPEETADQDPERAGAAVTSPEEPHRIPMPAALAFSSNHMWLDRNDSGTCHVGVDAFFTRSLGRIDAVAYPYHRDDHHPVVRFTVGGAVFDLAFPNTMHCTDINPHLTVDPTELMNDPYGRGWLFEGIAPRVGQSRPDDRMDKGLRRGPEARVWMDRECARLGSFFHEFLAGQTREGGLLLQDGGQPHGNLADILDGGTLLRLHNEFFSLHGKGMLP